MSNRFIDPVPQWLDNVGQPYASGSVEFCVTGTDTKADTFNSSALTTANINPVLLNAAGRFSSNGSNDIDVFLDPNVIYRVKFRDADGVLWRTVENVKDHAANVTAAFQVYNGDPNGHVAGNQGTVGGAGASVLWDLASEVIWVCKTTGTALTATWEALGSTLNSLVVFSGTLTPAALSANQNNYAPSGFATCSQLRQNSTGEITITGFGEQTTGRFFVYRNVSAYRHILLNQSTLSDGNKRMAMDGDLIVYPGQSVEFWYDGPLLRWKVQGAFFNAPSGDPGGRLTLTSGVPVLTSDVTAATTVYYSPYRHNFIRLYNGSSWYVAQFSELSQTLDDASKSPAAAAVSSVYDMFVWNDAGTLRCTRGPAWTSGTARGTGAGTTELERVDGTWVNKIAVTNGPAARRGIYVGTIATNATGSNGQMNMMFAPAAAAGGTDNRLDVWNCYNRVGVASIERDSTDSWAYTLATWRPYNGDTSNLKNRITVVCGISEDAVDVVATAVGVNNAGANIFFRTGIGVDVTNAFSGVTDNGAGNGGTSVEYTLTAHYRGAVGIGLRFFQMLELSDATGTTTWYGDNGGASLRQAALQLSWRM